MIDFESLGQPSRISILRNRKVVDLFLSQLVPLLSSMLMTFATATILGVSGRGELALVLSASGLVGALGYMSLQVGIVRAYRMGDMSAPRRGFAIASMSSASILACGVITIIFAPDLRVGLFDAPKIFMIACGGGLLIFNLVILRTRQGLGGSRVFRNASIIQATIFPAFGVPVAIALHSPTMIVLCWYLAIASSTIYALRNPADRAIETPLPEHVPTSEILKSSIAAHIGVSGQQLMFRADIVVLGFMASATSVGIYSVAVPIAGVTWVFSEALSLMSFDAGARRESFAQRRAHRLDLIHLNLLVSFVVAVAIGLSSIFFIPLILPEYTRAIPLILILLPGIVIQGCARIGLSSRVSAKSLWERCDQRFCGVTRRAG